MSERTKYCLTCDHYVPNSTGPNGICYATNPKFKKDGSCVAWKQKRGVDGSFVKDITEPNDAVKKFVKDSFGGLTNAEEAGAYAFSAWLTREGFTLKKENKS